jgi:hypothetical protein
VLPLWSGFWTGEWAHFTVNAMRSFNGAFSWGEPTLLFAPSIASGYNAGAPQVAVCGGTGDIVVTFLCDDGASADANAAAGWPNDAHVSLIFGRISNMSAPMSPIVWRNATEVVVAPIGSLWPGFLVEGNASARRAYVGYQAADDSSLLMQQDACELAAAAFGQ